MNEIKKRLKSETPVFFQKVQFGCMVIGGILTICGGTILNYSNVIGGIITAVGGTILTIGTFISSLPVKNINDLK